MATNVASAANGGVASASSEHFSGNYPASGTVDGDRLGTNWGAGGGWIDNSPNAFDDWLQVDFSGSNSINEIDVFGVQTNYLSPTTPTATMTSIFALRDFEIQYWNGSAWVTVTGGNITSNNLVWTRVTFAAITTTKIRVLVHASQDGTYSYVVELEAWTTAVPGTPTTPSPADGATGVSTTPTFSWSGPGATSFDVKLSTSNPPTTVVSSGQAGTSYTPSTRAGGTTYYWRIVAINASGSTTGPVWSFTTAAVVVGSLKPDVVVEVELSGEDAGWTNLGTGGYGDVVSDAGLSCLYGIPGSGPDDNVAPSGRGSFTLNNSAENSQHKIGLYSRYHANRLSGWDVDIRCRITLVDPATGTPRRRCFGRIDAIDPSPGKHKDRRVRVTVVDWLDEAANWSLVPEIGQQINRTWTQVLTAIIGLMPRQPLAVSLDDGVEAYPIALDTSSSSGQPALAEFKKLADSERGFIYQKADGTVRAEGRHARLLNTTSLWTLTEDDILDLSLPSTREEIIDTFDVTIHPRQPINPLPTDIVYSQANVIEIGPGENQLLLGSYRDEVTGDAIGAIDVQTPVATSPYFDYTANSNRDGTGTDITADFSVVLSAGPAGISATVTNGNAATGYLTSFSLRGRAVKDKALQTLRATSGAGKHVVPLDMPYQGNSDVGQGAADYYLAKYDTAYAQARRVGVIGKTSALLTQLLARDISDRITISETVTGVANDYFINAIEIKVLKTGLVMGTYTLAPAQDPFSGLYWVPDISTLGTDTRPAPF